MIKRYCLPLFEGTDTGKACYWVCDLTSEIPTAQLVPGDLVFVAEGAKFYKVPSAQNTTEIGSGGGAGSPAYTEFIKDLGIGRSGMFELTGAGLPVGKPVTVIQTAAPIPSKGNCRDEFEFDRISLTGYVLDATTIRVHWNATGVVSGEYAFAYLI